VDANNRNKKKILNDPVYGFISIQDDLIFDLIEHRYFQRLRRIKQLGLTHLVYPGALHTRFHHAIGTMHLMHQAIEVLRSKGHEITRDEENGAQIAILLHDIGHGPYSHTLENSIVAEISHEELSLIFMERLNTEFSGALNTAIAIFNNDYPKHFLHQLVSSQLDMDRLDYLKRDSFFTGVSEGVINTDRIIKMLDMVDDELVVEAKGIYSVEKFIIARRLMYWQVYLHKTVLSAENMLMQVIRRARFLALNGEKLFTTDAFGMFLQNEIGKDDFIKNPSILETFGELDDFDVFASIKMWTKANDKVLSTLSQNLVNRQLFRNEIQNKHFSQELVTGLKQKTATLYGISPADADYFVFSDIARNSAYNPFNDRINILFRDGKVQDITEASDQLNIEILSKTVTKYFLCYPKQVAGL
jgi:HD superfamily phosphohydrolase